MQSRSRFNSMLATAVLSSALAAGMLLAAPAALAQDATIHQVYEAAEAGKFIEAQKMMDQVLADHPNSGKAHFIEAELLAKQGKMARAATELATAERLAPGLKFAKPETVQKLRTAIASGSSRAAGSSIDFSRAPRLNPAATQDSTAPAPRMAAQAPVQESRGIPWGMILGIGALVVLAAMFFKRKAGNPGAGLGNAGNAGFGGNGGAYPNYPAGGAPQYGGPGAVPPQYAPQAGMGGGLGSGIVGGLATGAALGAGMVAGQALAHRFTDGNRSDNDSGNSGANHLGNNFNSAPQEDVPPAGYDMGGSDFGVDDSGGWDDSAGGGGGGSEWD